MPSELIEKIKTLGIIVKHREQLPYGNKDAGRLVPSERGRRAIFVPSFGTMEKEEVDYVVEVAQEQEDERIKRNEISPTKQRLEIVAQAAISAPSGQRAETARKLSEVV